MNNDNAPNQQQAGQNLWAIPRPDWDQWQSVRRTLLWKAVALLCNLAPNRLESPAFPNKLDIFFNRAPPNFINLLTLAKNNLGTDSLKPVALNAENLEDSEVELSTFATWAKSIGQPIPPEFIWKPEMAIPITSWPWGKHNTTLLQKLALAADRFWVNYDPTDPTSAPTNQEIVDWLIRQKVSARIADAMATILRADAPPGPRK